MLEARLSADVTQDRIREVSIVVPCFNEGDAIAGIVDRILAYLKTFGPRLSSEIVVVDDGSSDATAHVLQEVSTNNPSAVTVVRHVHNAGLTQAMRTGADAARFGTVVFLDADLSYAPEVVGELFAAKEATGAALAIASPYMSSGRVGNVPFVRLAASRGANFLLSFTLGRKIRTFTGMVRAYDTAVFRALAQKAVHGEFNSAMVAEILKAGLGIVEIPAALVWPGSRTANPSRISLEMLRKRTKLVIDTFALLIKQGKGTDKISSPGTFDLVIGPKGHYSPERHSEIL